MRSSAGTGVGERENRFINERETVLFMLRIKRILQNQGCNQTKTFSTEKAGQMKITVPVKTPLSNISKKVSVDSL